MKAKRVGNPAYESWKMMRRRCYKSSFKDFKYYGARGVTVCDRWNDQGTGFDAFLADLGPRPSGTTLDRIDPHGNYEPGNCRWADVRTQSRNTRRTRRHNGVLLMDLAAAHGVSTKTLQNRLKRGVPLEDAVRPDFSDREKLVPYMGGLATYRELAALSGIPYRTIYQRMNVSGLTVEQALAMPYEKRGKIVFDGVEATLKSHCEARGLKYGTIWARLNTGWSLEDALRS